MAAPTRTPEGEPGARFLAQVGDMVWWRLPSGTFLVATDGNYYHACVGADEARRLLGVLSRELTP